MKRILVITTSFPEKNDGSEAAGTFVADFVEELARHVSVSVLSPGMQNARAENGNVQIFRFQVPQLPLSLLKPYNPLHWPSIIRTLRGGQKALDELTASQQFDHVLALWALPSGHWARNGKNHVPYSIWALGSDIWALRHVPLVRSILRKVLTDAHFRFADGLVLADDVNAICGRSCIFLPSSRVLVKKSSTERIAAPPYKLAFLGRFHHNKGIDLLLESLTLLNEEDWRAIGSIRIAGGGPLQTVVEDSIGKLKAQGLPVHLEGYKNREEAQELLDWGDIVLIPSRIESIPVIFSDAMQLGKPVIATPVGDFPSLLKEYEVGTLSDNIGPASYARLLTAASLTNTVRMACNTHHAATKFSVAASARNFLALLNA